MSDTKPLTLAPPQATLYVIATMRWVREWHDTSEVRRAHLLTVLDRFLKQMGSSPDQGRALRYMLLGGQTVILEDINAVRPDLVAMMVIYNAGARLGLGPWYTLVDESLVSGESLIRNLLMARLNGVRHGIKLSTVAYMPDQAVHCAQLPQILHGFGIGTVMIRRHHALPDMAFRWQSPDGSRVLAVVHDALAPWSPEGQPDVKTRVEAQRASHPDGPFLWMQEYDDSLKDPLRALNDMEGVAGTPVTQGGPLDYVRALRGNLVDADRPTIGGELNPQTNGNPSPGSLSTRMHLKQTHTRLQSRLTYALEPWLTVALTHGHTDGPDNLRALSNHAWRLLLQNQSRTTLGGCISDRVTEETEQRYRRIEDGSTQVIAAALNALPGTPNPAALGAVYAPTPTSTQTTYVVVWNPHNWPVKQVVNVPLYLADGKYPARIHLADDQTDVIFGWTPADEFDQHSGTLSFVAEPPGLGYTTFTIELADTPPGEHTQTRKSSGRVIGSVDSQTLTAHSDNTLSWQRDKTVINDLLRFYDGGDAGDAYHYSKPEDDVIVQAKLTDDVSVESSPLYERLHFRHRLRIAPALNAERKRPRGLKAIDLMTTATFYHHTPGLFFHTTYENTAQDHRLRVHLRTGLQARSLLTGSVFGFHERPLASVVPMQTVAAIEASNAAMMLRARGLPEIEAHNEDGKITLALTLLRAIGWLSRDDLTARPGNIAPPIPTPAAQCLRQMHAEYALVDARSGDRSAFLRAAAAYQAPLQAYQYDTRPERPRRSFLSVISDMADGSQSDGVGAVVTAFKPPQKGRGWIVRLFNPNPRPAEILITPHTRPEVVQQVNLAEEPMRHLETDANGRAAITIGPQQIMTLRLRFD